MLLSELLADSETKLKWILQISSRRRHKIPQLDGTDDYISFGDVQDMGTGSFSVEVRGAFNISQVDDGAIASKWGATGAGWQIYVTTGNLLKARVTDGTNFVEVSANFAPYMITSPHINNIDHRVSLVVDRAAQLMYLYVDGHRLATSASIAAVGSVSNSESIRLGSRSSGANFIAGNIFDFRLFSDARTASEVKRYRGSNAVSFGADNLVLYAPLSEGVGTIAFDMSGRGQHGTISGATWVDQDVVWYPSTSMIQLTPDSGFNVILPGTLSSLEALSISLSFPQPSADQAVGAPFSGLPNTQPGTAIIAEQPTSVVLPDGRLWLDSRMDEISKFTFKGRTVYVRVCPEDEDGNMNDTFLYNSYVCTREPSVTAEDGMVKVSFEFGSTLEVARARETSVAHYSGIPHAIETLIVATSVGGIVPYNAAYWGTSFTLGCRFKFTSLPAAARNVFTRVQVTPLRSFGLQILTTGKLQIAYTHSSGTVATLVPVMSAINDGLYHTAIVGVNETQAYIVLDRMLIGLWPLAQPVDTATSGELWLWRSIIGFFQDARMFNKYISPAEAIALFDSYPLGTEDGCVGCWRYDDNGGTVANDYSPTANDAAISGAVGTEFNWVKSALGMPAIAGKAYPTVYGTPFNCKAHLIDDVREIFRVHDVDVEQEPYLVSDTRRVDLKARGVALVETTDYADNNDGTYTMVAQEDEPVTFDVVQTENTLRHTLPFVLNEAAKRFGFRGNEVTSNTSFEYLLPWQVGLFSDEDPNLAKIAKEVCEGTGTYVDFASVPGLSNDVLMPNFLFPPTGLGPYRGAYLESHIRGGNATSVGINFGDRADVSGSVTVATWGYVFNTQRNSTITSVATEEVVWFVNKDSNYKLGYVYSGTNRGKFVFQTIGSSTRTLYSPVGLVEPGEFFFLVGVFDSAASTMTMYLGRKGYPLAQVATATGMSNTLSGGGILVVEWLWGAVTGVHVWSVTKNLAQLQALMDVPPVGNEANLLFYAPMDEGNGDVEEYVSGLKFTPSGYLRWVPYLTVDMSLSPSVKLQNARRHSPLGRARVQYNKNWNVMTEADIANSLSQAQRALLTVPYNEVLYSDASVLGRIEDTLDIVVPPALKFADDAAHLLKLLKLRHAEERWVADVDFDGDPAHYALSRLSLGLHVNDQILVISPVPSEFSEGRMMRVLGSSPKLTGSTNAATVWG